ncbi:MAG: rRNA adenine N-6-methyltransferase family protein [Nanoarchaeota archaeon]|nr:rRNA adenine N-6-methyltransferase family protein [Nanoarchaeota archaeon]
MNNLDLGQHFLVDEEVLEKEIDSADITKKDKVIEIGAGRGNLTEKLADNAKEVLAFEIDKRFFKYLNKLGKKYDNLKVIFDNALLHSWKGYSKIVSNIPYHLSEEVINKAIISDIKEITLIVGKNFKELLFSDEKVGIIARKFYDIEEIMDVPKTSFEPLPSVNSSLIKFIKRDKIGELDKLIINISLGGGKIKNSIIRALLTAGKTKRKARELIIEMDLDENILDKPAKMITSKLLLRIESELEKVYK